MPQSVQVKSKIYLWLGPVSHPEGVPFSNMHKGTIWPSTSLADVTFLIDSLCDMCQECLLWCIRNNHAGVSVVNGGPTNNFILGD